MLTYHVLVFDEARQLPELFVVDQHVAEILICGRIPIFENCLVPVEGICIDLLACKLFHN